MQVFNISKELNVTLNQIDDARLIKQILEASELIRILLMCTSPPKIYLDPSKKKPMHYNHPVTKYYKSLMDPKNPFDLNGPIAFLTTYAYAFDEERYRRKNKKRHHKHFYDTLNYLPSNLIEECKKRALNNYIIPENMLLHCDEGIINFVKMKGQTVSGKLAPEVCKVALTYKWLNGTISPKARQTPSWTNVEPPDWYTLKNNVKPSLSYFYG